MYYHHRKEVNEFLGSNGSINHSNYYRILALGLLDVLLTLPISILGITVDAVQEPIDFWPGWAAGHADWSEIAQAPASLWQSIFWVNFTIRWDEWINTAFALVFFLLFGLTGEARAGYRRAFWAVAGLFRIKPSSGQPLSANYQKGDISAMVFDSVVIDETASSGDGNTLVLSPLLFNSLLTSCIIIAPRLLRMRTRPPALIVPICRNSDPQNRHLTLKRVHARTSFDAQLIPNMIGRCTVYNLCEV